jgi:hypothetical protein
LEHKDRFFPRVSKRKGDLETPSFQLMKLKWNSTHSCGFEQVSAWKHGTAAIRSYKPSTNHAAVEAKLRKAR